MSSIKKNVAFIIYLQEEEKYAERKTFMKGTLDSFINV